MRKISAVFIAVIMVFCFIPQTIFAHDGFDANAEYGRGVAHSGCTLSSVNGVDACTLDGKLHICSINFEDLAFRNFLTDKYGSEFVSIDTILTTDEIQPAGEGIESLEGIEFFRDLDWLGCFSNDLTELDIRNNPNITTLFCAENKLTSLDLRYNTKLDFVNCISNHLSELLVSDDCKITVLSIAKNRFASFDVSKMMSLESLYAIDQTIVLEETDSIDMSAYVGRNDWGKISDVQGGYFDAGTGMLYVDEGAESVSYVYDTGLYDLPNYIPDPVPDDEKLIVTFRIGADPVPSGWQVIDGKTYYYDEDGEMLTWWQRIGQDMYYFDDDGVMQTGWLNEFGFWYYFDADGKMVTGWKQLDGTWYYLDDRGRMATGWQKIDGTWYYFKGSGAMVTGSLEIDGITNHFDGSGAWISPDGSTAPIVDSGKCGDNEWVDDVRFTVDGDGVLTISGTGKMADFYYHRVPTSDDGHWQIYSNIPWRGDHVDSIVISPGVTSIGNYAFCECDIETIEIPEGVVSIGWSAFEGCYFLESIELPQSMTFIGGEAFSGCANLSDIYYHGNAHSWDNIVYNNNSYAENAEVHFLGLADGWLRSGINNSWYFYKDNKALTGWQKIGRTWYYFAGSGAMATGWQNVSGTWYYFKDSGAMATGWQKIGGSWYFFAGSGAMVTGWYKDGSTWYYFKDSGAMATGWQTIDGTWYYFKSSGAMAAGEWCDGYWLNADGSWTYQPRGSWKQDSTGWWFGDTSGWYAKNTTVKIDGTNYRFNASGYWVK